MKAGGGAKCLTLRLTEPETAGAKAASSVQSRELKLDGHLLDSGLMDRALELTVQSGGSFQILHFNLGKQRQSTSQADIQISAPSEEVLDKIMGGMIELGAVAGQKKENDAELKTVHAPGRRAGRFSGHEHLSHRSPRRRPLAAGAGPAHGRCHRGREEQEVRPLHLVPLFEGGRGGGGGQRGRPHRAQDRVARHARRRARGP